jgi:hypothetical protein
MISIFLFSYQNVTVTVLTHLVCIQAGEHAVVFSDPAMYCGSAEYKSWLPFLVRTTMTHAPRII